MPKTSSPPSVMEPQCPSRLVLERIADKWTALIIQILSKGTMRYSALQQRIGGISQKMLTQTLRSLERDGLVQRKVYPVVPPRVEYSLSRLGRTLIEPLRTLCRWSEKHLAELQANRARAKTKLDQVEANWGRFPRTFTIQTADRVDIMNQRICLLYPTYAAGRRVQRIL